MENSSNATYVNQLITLHHGNAHDTYNVTLLEFNLNTDTCFKNFTGEALGAVVKAEKNRVEYNCSENIFKF